MKISDNKYVAVIYDLNVGEGEERELMEKATREVPLKFTGMMIPAFEKELMGLEPGQKFNFSIAPADAYGEYNEEHVLDLPFSYFFPHRLSNPVLPEGETRNIVVDENFLLLYEPAFEPGQTYTFEVLCD
jgi:FKBP-type peptidyl-prolyl cis-trans isomerase SlyD